MNAPWQIKIYERQQPVYESEELLGPLEVGRQGEGEEGPYSLTQESSYWRLVIARREEDTISRRHALVEPLSGGQFRLTNLRDRLPIRLDDRRELKPKESYEFSLPYVLTLGRKTLRVQTIDSENLVLKSLPESTRPPRSFIDGSSRIAPLAWSADAAMEKEAVYQWLHATMQVLQSACSSSDFFQQAVQAAVDVVGLDSCRLLLREKGEWITRAARTEIVPDLNAQGKPSRQVLNQLTEEKKTFWQLPGQETRASSLAGIKAVVAAPILNPRGDVIGALYGDRFLQSPSGALPPITKLEAMLIELLACGVAAGLARLEQEKAALKARVLLEQTFTSELARKLELHPEMLKGQDAEVTVLFCDIRGFSRISERLEAARTMEWVGEVMSALSDCVSDQDGVLVDYIGDELIAMWGAPDKQETHARLACQAALQMLSELAKLNERWRPELGEYFGLGIGINSGPARVGPTGSQRKFKYGPLGNSVNLASRVQGACKYLQTSLLITESTRAQLGEGMALRRLCRVRVVNIKEPVDLFEVGSTAQPGWSVLQEQYEKALMDFEKSEFQSARRTLFSLLADYPDDGPSLALLTRVLNCQEGVPPDHPVWELSGK